MMRRARNAKYESEKATPGFRVLFEMWIYTIERLKISEV